MLVGCGGMLVLRDLVEDKDPLLSSPCSVVFLRAAPMVPRVLSDTRGAENTTCTRARCILLAKGVQPTTLLPGTQEDSANPWGW